METILFDLDDTLIKTSDFYAAAAHHYLELLEAQGFNREDVERLLWQIDDAKINTWKSPFSSTRFPSSMQEAYLESCIAAGIHPNQDIVEQLREIGAEAVSHPVQLIEGTLDALTALKDGYHLVVVTRGNAADQRRKLETAGLNEFFPDKNVYILNRAGGKKYEPILRSRQLSPDQAWVVGDSIRSDINPAIQIGLRCVHIPYNNKLSWRWGYDMAAPVSSAYYTLSSIKRLPAFLFDLE